MNNDLTISKANTFVEASYSMTLDEMRILALTLGTFNPQNPTRRDFEFTVDEFCKYFPEVDPKSAYTQIQKAIVKVARRDMVLRDDEKMFVAVPFLTKRTYFKQEGRFLIEFHDELMPYISELHGKYTEYQLVNVVAFTSTHSIRLYELCSQYRDTGWRQTTIAELKDWLQIKNKYDLYANFRRRVLEPAIAEINAKSDLLVSVEPIKRGRTIKALRFSISVKKEAKTVEVEKNINLTKDGRPKLPQRPQVQKGSHEEGEWARKCIEILLEHEKQLKEQGKELSNDDLELLKKYHSIIGDKMEVKRIEKILKSRAERTSIGIDIFANIKSNAPVEIEVPDNIPEPIDEDQQKIQALMEEMNEIARIQAELLEKMQKLQKNKTA